MANQPFSGGQWKRISGTAAGTTNVMTTSGNLYSIYLPATKTGTASFYDQNAGTSSANFIFDLANTVGTIPTSLNLSLRVKNGLTVVVGGTTDMTVVYD